MKSNPLLRFGKLLLELRENKELSQTDLTKIAQSKYDKTIPPNMISIWERGLRTRAQVSHLKLITVLDDILGAKGSLLELYQATSDDSDESKGSFVHVSNEKLGIILQIGSLLPEGTNPALAVSVTMSLASFFIEAKLSVKNDELTKQFVTGAIQLLSTTTSTKDTKTNEY